MNKTRLLTFSSYLILIIMSLFYLFPIYLTLITGLKNYEEISLNKMWDLPTFINVNMALSHTFKGQFAAAFREIFPSFYRAWFGESSQGIIGLNRGFWNSVKLSIPAALISSVFGSINGFVLAKWRFRGANILLIFLLFGMFIPYQVILIPLVKLLQNIGVYGTLRGLILVHSVYGIPITTLIFHAHYAKIPDELVEAAKIDGANIEQTYFYLVLPYSLPSFVVAVIWQFSTVWNDFLFAAVIATKPDMQTISVMVNNLAGSYVVEWNVQMAGALIAALPPLLVYVVLGSYFVKGILGFNIEFQDSYSNTKGGRRLI